MSRKARSKNKLKNHLRVKRLIAVNCFDLSPKFLTGQEIHDYWEFVYIDGGEVNYCVGDTKGVLKQGDIVFHQPGEIHSTICNGRQSASIFTIIFDCNAEVMSFFVGKVMKTPKKLMHLLKNLISECGKAFYMSEYPLKRRSNALFGSEQLAVVYLEEFLLLMIRSCQDNPDVTILFDTNENLNDTLADEICKYLEENVYHRVTLNELAEKYHFGKSYLCEQFKKAKGASIMGYHLELKLAEAKRLLREDTIPVYEISKMLGFESPEYFSRYFKKRVGHSPRDFRNMLINDSSLRSRK